MKFGLKLIGIQTLIVFWLIAGGCGGSGSSGFDAMSMEQNAIEQVSTEGGCAELDGTTICSSEEAVETGTAFDGGSPGGMPESISLTIDPPSRSSISCLDQISDEDCTLMIRIAPSGFPMDTSFIAAVRFHDDFSRWSLSLTPFEISNSMANVFASEIQLEALPSPSRDSIQIAVLVYLPDSALPSLGSTELLLRDLGADFVFVATEIHVRSEAGSLANTD